MTCMVNSTALAVENEIKLAGNSNVSEISIIEEVCETNSDLFCMYCFQINLGSNGQCGLMDEDGQKKVVVDYGVQLFYLFESGIF